MEKENTDIILYITEDGGINIEVQSDGNTVWLTQAQMCELFGRDKSVISRHINNVFTEGELDRNSVVAKNATTASDGKVYETSYYNLDVIISVGYRVKSHRGTQFRIWATERLREYIIKGFTMNDELLKNAGGGNYFDELLERIRDIRSSEKVFWRKVLDIYSTSVDYDPRTEQSILFFKTVQNKMHYASHGHTASEIIYDRVNSNKENLGLTNFKGTKPTKAEMKIAKNYLTKDELDVLNRIVSGFLEIAELNALRKNVMYMSDWIERLDDFLKMSGSDVLDNAGNISKKMAEEKVQLELDKYKKRNVIKVTDVEKHYITAIDEEFKKIK